MEGVKKNQLEEITGLALPEGELVHTRLNEWEKVVYQGGKIRTRRRKPGEKKKGVERCYHCNKVFESQ